MTRQPGSVPSRLMLNVHPVHDDGSATAEFDAFYRAVEPRIRRAVVAACGMTAGVEATAAAMELAYRRWDEVSSLENPAGYVYRVARNAARRRRKALPGLPPLETERYGFEPALPRALQRLSEQQRQAVLLVHASGCTLPEAAAVLGVSVSTLRNHLDRGVARLRKHLGVTSE